MPDLSILVELADYYDIEIKELLDGERSSTMNKEMKETLNKVADYEDWVKQKALKAGNLAFASMFLISVGAIIIQLLLAVNLRLVLGETLIALVGGIVYAFIMVHNGIWDKGLSAKEALWRDFLCVLWYLPEKNGGNREANDIFRFTFSGWNYNRGIYCSQSIIIF